MENLQEQENNNNEPEVTHVPEGSSLAETLLRGLLDGYEEGYNKANDKNEIELFISLTTHKVATPDGNKDVAYLVLVRALRPKDWENVPGLKDDPAQGWSTQNIHQEVYFFKSVAERVNPNSKWKETLYMNTIGRLVSAGIEYAELLQKLKQVQEGKKVAGVDDTEQRAEKIGLTLSTEMPKPLSPAEQEYKEWIANERAKEGIV